MRVTFLAPRLPPAVCGVGDHTANLARALADRGIEVGFLSFHAQQAATRDLLTPGPLGRWSGSPASLADCISRQVPDWLWVQLSGYGFSRWGAPWGLYRALRAVRRKFPRLRIAVCMHEGHCEPADLGWKGPLLSPWQRFTVGAVARIANVNMATIPLMERLLRDAYRVSAEAIAVLPIGSNLPVVLLGPEEVAAKRQQLGWGLEETVAVAFGSWGKQIAALAVHGDCLASAARLGNVHRVVCVGGDSQGPPPASTAWRLAPPLTDRLTILGPREARELATILACSDLGLTSTPREFLCKSSAFMAMMDAGLSVLVHGQGEPGYGVGDLSGCMAPARFASETISRAALAAWGRQLQALAAKTFSWEAIAARAEEILRAPAPETS